MKVTQVKCPKCNTAISMKQKDKFFICGQCNTLHVRDDGKPETVAYDIAELHPAAKGESVYVPFWRLTCTMVIHARRVEGGTISRLANWISGAANRGGVLYVYVPAAEFDPGTFKRLAMLLTENPPNYSTRFNFGGIKSLPAVVTRAESTELADFVLVSMEAEQAGVLQQLDYTLNFNDSKIVYLPFLTAGFAPAF